MSLNENKMNSIGISRNSQIYYIDPIEISKNSQISYSEGVKNLVRFCKFCLLNISAVCECASKVGGSPLK